MKAITCHNDGSPAVITYEAIEKPTVGDDDILIKVRAASVNPMDGFTVLVARLSGKVAGRFNTKATRLGTDVAGEVEAVGKNVTQFQPGDAVFGFCRGAFAEYVCTTERNVTRQPANLSFESAASVPVAAITALQALRDKGQIQPGQKVLIQGASGGVGTFAMQMAKAFGAEVTAVCSTRNLATARSLGADHVIDYTKVDFTQNGPRYDLILAVNGYHSIFSYRRALRPGGVCVVVGGAMAQIAQALLLAPVLAPLGNKQVRFMGIAKNNPKDLAFIAELLADGKVVPVIDRCYPLSAVAEAIKYLGEGHARGKVVITMEENHE